LASTDIFAQYVAPPLCSFNPHLYDVGAKAAAVLAAALRGELAEPHRVLMPLDFVCRSSCGPAPECASPAREDHVRPGVGAHVRHGAQQYREKGEGIVTDVDVVIVGAGHNGLVAAAYLARAGLTVHLFERRPIAGGASITEELWPGFHFSTCAHMIHGLHPKLIRDLGLRERGLRVLPRADDLIMWADGTYSGPDTLDSPRNRAFAGRLTAEEREGLRRYQEFRWTLERLFAPYRLQPPPSLAEVRARAQGTPAAAVLERALTAHLVRDPGGAAAERTPPGTRRRREIVGRT